MNNRISVLSEPKIVFGDNRSLTDPHAGLSLFGPYDGGSRRLCVVCWANR